MIPKRDSVPGYTGSRNNTMKNLLKRMLNIVPVGIFIFLHKLALSRLGFGTGGTATQSGEANALSLLNLPERPIIFDVGANKGDYVQLLYKKFPYAQIHAFEPVRRVYDELKKNAPSSIKTYNIGFSNAKRVATIHFNPAKLELSSLYERRLEHFNKSLSDSEEIMLSTISDFCRENNIKKIDFLKLDIEGHEFAALQGAKDIDISAIQFEFGGANLDSRKNFQDFFYLLKDYTIYRILYNSLLKIERYKEEDEVYLTTNYLAIKK